MSDLFPYNNKLFVLLFNFMIPESRDYGMPGADVLLKGDTKFSADDLNKMHEISESFESISNSEFNCDINSLSEDEIIRLFKFFKKKSSRQFYDLVNLILSYYYSNRIILDKLKTLSIPPFPDGNKLSETDLLIFEKTYLRERIFRE